MCKPEYILALDQGTTSSRSILFNHTGEIVCQAQKELNQYYPKPGWVEHNPMQIWSSQVATMEEILAANNIRPESIAGIGITNQRETTILWERATALPVYNAIVWPTCSGSGHASTFRKCLKWLSTFAIFSSRDCVF